MRTYDSNLQAQSNDSPGLEQAPSGGDINELEAMALAGLAACPADAISEVRDRVDFVCTLKGGHGVVGELAEINVDAQCKPGS